MTMRLWITFWVVVYLALDALDAMADRFGRLLDEEWFAGAVLTVNVFLLLRVLGVW